MNTQPRGAEVMFGISSFNQIRNWVLCLRTYLYIPEGPSDIFSSCSKTIATETGSFQEEACSAPPQHLLLFGQVLEEFSEEQWEPRLSGNLKTLILDAYGELP